MITITENISEYMSPQTLFTLINKSASARKIFNLRLDRIKRFVNSKKIPTKKKKAKSTTELSRFSAKLGKCSQEYIEKHVFESITSY